MVHHAACIPVDSNLRNAAQIQASMLYVKLSWGEIGPRVTLHVAKRNNPGARQSLAFKKNRGDCQYRTGVLIQANEEMWGEACGCKISS